VPLHAFAKLVALGTLHPCVGEELLPQVVHPFHEIGRGRGQHLFGDGQSFGHALDFRACFGTDYAGQEGKMIVQPVTLGGGQRREECDRLDALPEFQGGTSDAFLCGSHLLQHGAPSGLGVVLDDGGAEPIDLLLDVATMSSFNIRNSSCAALRAGVLELPCSASPPLMSLIIGLMATSQSCSSGSNSPTSTKLRRPASFMISRKRVVDIAWKAFGWTMSR
jgi:hypothetical protein